MPPVRGAKKAVNVSIPAELLAASRAENINLSVTLEAAIEERLRERRREKWLERNSAGIAAYNNDVDEHGVFGDALRSF